MAWKVKDLQTSGGKKLIESFIIVQERKTQAKITRMIITLGKYGPSLGMPFSKKIDKNLWELRISGKEAIRIFYTFKGSEIVLLHIFKKKTERIPQKEIKLATQRIERL